MVDIKQELREIKTALRLNMNGVASQRMRESGFDYKVNFGVELPRLQTIAAERRQSLAEQGATDNEVRSLAQTLWLEPIRESRILACLLMPVCEFTRDLADVWVEQIPNVEIARLYVMYLLVHVPYAIDLSFTWIASDSDWRQTCGLLLVTRLLMGGMQLEERSLLELRDQAEAAAASSNPFVAQAARTVMQRVG